MTVPSQHQHATVRGAELHRDVGAEKRIIARNAGP
jgi:hypothetical protein